ncbi:NAD(P)-dependent oxidoreductase [Mycolicibacterium mengxianglii]|uniref:NAD(P)-dependent oxidoreductase n=1 Tax=Mycolicibacterium mengxianglii TaxID=2736649 RepID=UPI0018D04578|nr:NAD(P)-dependent oxidoreductase [Mycolicibacterium mengxianglii]
MKVGFVGAGRMGAPMIKRLVAAGHEVHALGRTDEKRTAVAELGATPVGSAQATTDGADIVVVCVFTDDQVQRICVEDGLAAALPAGAVLVLHTTGSPHTAHVVADIAARSGAEVLDAPVSGGPHDIAAGAVTLFVGGSANAFDRAQPALASYGDPILHVGALGYGQKVKLINNTLFAAQIGLLAEAVKLGDSLGIDETALLRALPHGSGSSRALAGVAARGSVAAFIATAGPFVGKDIAVVRQTVAELGADLGVLDTVVTAGLSG